MNNKLLIILIGLGLLIAYLLGIYWPQVKVPEIEDCMITQAEYNTMLLRALAAIATFCAAFVALFKEDIRSIWKHVKLNASTSKIQESLGKTNVNTGKVNEEILTANYYSAKISIPS